MGFRTQWCQNEDVKHIWKVVANTRWYSWRNGLHRGGGAGGGLLMLTIDNFIMHSIAFGFFVIKGLIYNKSVLW